jgi:hypothetical protein
MIIIFPGGLEERDPGGAKILYDCLQFTSLQTARSFTLNQEIHV